MAKPHEFHPYRRTAFVVWYDMRYILISLITAAALSLSTGAFAQDNPETKAPKTEQPVKKKSPEMSDKAPAEPLSDFYKRAEEEAKKGPYCSKSAPIV